MIVNTFVISIRMVQSCNSFGDMKMFGLSTYLCKCRMVFFTLLIILSSIYLGCVRHHVSIALNNPSITLFWVKDPIVFGKVSHCVFKFQRLVVTSMVYLCIFDSHRLNLEARSYKIPLLPCQKSRQENKIREIFIHSLLSS